MTKSKFAGLAEARMKQLESETSEGGTIEDEGAEKPAKKQTSKLAKQQASKLAVKKTSKLASNKASSKVVGVTIRIPEEKRIWWNVQATLQRTTLTAAIIEALDKRFGPPKKI